MQLDKKDSFLSDDIQSEKLQLFMSCRNLINLGNVANTYLVIKLQDSTKHYKQILKTKIYPNDLNPNYAESVIIDFFFESNYLLKQLSKDYYSKLIGRVETSVGQVFGSPDNGLLRQLRDDNNKQKGKIIIRCEKVHTNVKNIYILKIRAQNLPNFKYWYFFGGTSPFFRIIRKRKSDELLIYQSQVINYNTNPAWKQFKITSGKLCSNDENLRIQVRFFNYSSKGNHTLIGSSFFSEAILNKTRTFQINKDKQNAGKLIFQKVDKNIQYQFGDFLERGLQLALVTCIDFTASNGDYKKLDTLHFVSKIVKSPYQKALEEVTNILIDYDSDKLVPVYGFGAKVNMPTFDSGGKVHHCFPLNGNEDNPYIYQAEGIIEAYKTCFKYLTFSGPTQFSALFQKAIEQCKQFKKDNNEYMILFILTDGQIHDRAKVIDYIIQCCKLPISIIIVGIGKGDFKIMHELDDDSSRIVDSKGNHNTRDCVQFVQFESVKNNSIDLAREVLEELPRQVSEYFMNVGIEPSDIRKPSKRTDIQLQMQYERQLRQREYKKRMKQL